MPATFILMLFSTAIVYAAPAASELFDLSYGITSLLMLLPGMAAIGSYVYLSERRR
jgi:uncharacterized membrane protein YkvI